MKKFLIAAAAALVMTAPAWAMTFGPAPSSYEADAVAYVSDRVEDETARISVVGAPYRVLADVDGGDDEACWAVDVRVRMSLGAGRTGRDTMTVLFLDGEAVALDGDLSRSFARVDDGYMLASN